ncbi:MAG: aminodeoxychorismate synthase component I [Chitinivibrionales bacterium]|nr:aminodeoxychorismate synthase component I [Chitinivibrionales bacterium]
MSTARMPLTDKQIRLKHMAISFNSGSLGKALAGASSAVFLDTARSVSRKAVSYLFMDPVEEVYTCRFSGVDDVLEQVERLSRSCWVAGYLCYEAAYALESRFLSTAGSGRKRSQSPLAWFGVFEKPHIFDHGTRSRVIPLPECESRQPPGGDRKPGRIIHSIEYPEYARVVSQVKQWIARGHTYQVNFTHDTHYQSDASPFSLYCTLRKTQPAAFSGYVKNRFGHVLSFSPELFFSASGKHITVKPMKGTAPRGRWPEEDTCRAQSLKNSPKDTSENVMIVDLLRNDLGRICKTGSVSTKRLFEVETHYTLHQMTSTITGRLCPGIGFSDIIRNLFPCGSVTGAPKIRTMEIIRSLERRDRGVYCGALGFAAPGNRAVFSVPIRTLQKKRGAGQWRFRVGSGIVWDSKAEDEWNECLIKTGFLTRPAPEFEIFESILFDTKPVYLRDHVARFRRSAGFFGFPFCGNGFNSILGQVMARCRGTGRSKVRIFLRPDGHFRWDAVQIDTSEPVCRRLIISPELTDSNELLLFHKTTYRPWYRRAMEKIRSAKCYDIAFFNTRGELTEGARSNIFVRKAGDLVTPGLCSGLLPGILRSRLLKQGKCREGIITKKDLYAADEIYCGNSVRGMVRVRVYAEE